MHTLYSSAAFAHTRPQVLGLVSDAQDTVTRARIAHGLVARDAEGRLRFLCPRLWGGPDTPLAARVGDRAQVAVGSVGPFLVADDGSATALAIGGLSALSARQILDGPRGALVLATDAAGSNVFEVGVAGARPLFSVSAPVDSIALVDGRLLTARTSSVGLALEVRDIDGALERAISIPATLAAGTRAKLVRAEKSTYVVLSAVGTSTLARLRDVQLEYVTSSTSAIDGPVSAGERLVALMGGVLHRIGESDLGPIDASARFSCLDRGETGAYVCAGTELRRLEEDGTPGAVAFALSEVQPPALDRLDAESRTACRDEWRDFALESGVDPRMTGDTPDGGTAGDLGPEEVGCSCRGARGERGSWINFAIGLVAVVSRRRLLSAPCSYARR